MADTMTLEEVRGQLSSWFGGSEACGDVKACDRLGEMINALDAAIKQREQDAKDAERYRWLAQYPNLFTVNDLLRADQYTTLTRACDALMSVAAMAKESGNE